ncbi:PREDICTED: uncharacterized protein LOC104814725 [Tarenaya hassleriana]|uniref:uncharacterized protein LOC104814725 n=1 Tax=Tarenaya hassleriana TaxID=28532 RepID=UPI00053C5C40|nr:PREDICTED: uncharacterized protein LOC104814725 [Tarenaya hassleriana]
MVVFTWCPSLDQPKPKLIAMPTWVTFKNLLLLPLYNSDSLNRIATSVGNPLYLDRTRTKKENLLVAPVFVDVPLDSSSPSVVVVSILNDKAYRISVAYDWLPLRCNLHSEMGHGGRFCPNHHVNSDRPAHSRTRDLPQSQALRQNQVGLMMEEEHHMTTTLYINPWFHDRYCS